MIEERINAAGLEFSSLGNDMLRYSFLVELSKCIPNEAEEIMSEANLLKECQSKVWVKFQVDSDGCFNMLATSDTLIIRGLLYVVMQILNGCNVKEVSESSLNIFQTCNVQKHFNIARREGISSLMVKVKQFCCSNMQSGSVARGHIYG